MTDTATFSTFDFPFGLSGPLNMADVAFSPCLVPPTVKAVT
jgi:hypothetical protein